MAGVYAPDGSLNVTIAGGSASVTGGATETKQDTQITALDAIETAVDGLEAKLDTLIANEADFTAGEYETAGAGATTTLGGTGAVGDYLDAVLIVPGTTAAGAVSIKDGADSAITIFAGGATTPLSDLAPIYVPVGAKSRTGAWQIVTLANVTAIGFGNFSA